MDKESAKFILASFRPDGADAVDAAFAEALAMAMENRELGEWLASERAFDSAFSAALSTVQLPDTLRDEISACFAMARGDFPQADDEGDAAFVGAFSLIAPPPELREQILQAMQHTAQPARVIRPWWPRAAVPLAVAAGFAVAWLIASPKGIPGASATAKIRPEVVQANLVKTLAAEDFTLEVIKEDSQDLITHLRKEKVPYPGALPMGLARLKGLGCREIDIDGRRGSLICMRLGGGGTIHLLTFLREDVAGDFPSDKPHFSQENGWARAQWQDTERVYFLMKKSESTSLEEYF